MLGVASDRRLVRRASGGDRRAIATIYERYRQELYGFCLGLLGEPQDAQDALQNTMVKVLRALPGEEREIALRPWLYRIARNEAIELQRRRCPTQRLEGHLVDGHSSVAEHAEHREQLGWLLRDLGDLPERQRTVLVMRELNGLDFAAIGAALDTSGAVVRQSLYEARRNLAQMDHGREMNCELITRLLSDGDGRIVRRRDIRAHLRGCPDCRHFRDRIGTREGLLAMIPPVSLSASTVGGQALLGTSVGSGAVAVLAGGLVKSAGVSGALKAAGTLAAVAAIGTAAIHGGATGGASDPVPRDAAVHARAGPAHLSPGPVASRRVGTAFEAPAAGVSPRSGRGGQPIATADSRLAPAREPRAVPEAAGQAEGTLGSSSPEGGSGEAVRHEGDRGTVGVAQPPPGVAQPSSAQPQPPPSVPASSAKTKGPTAAGVPRSEAPLPPTVPAPVSPSTARAEPAPPGAEVTRPSPSPEPKGKGNDRG